MAGPILIIGHERRARPTHRRFGAMPERIVVELLVFYTLAPPLQNVSNQDQVPTPSLGLPNKFGVGGELEGMLTTPTLDALDNGTLGFETFEVEKLLVVTGTTEVDRGDGTMVTADSSWANETNAAFEARMVAAYPSRRAAFVNLWTNRLRFRGVRLAVPGEDVVA